MAPTLTVWSFTPEARSAVHTYSCQLRSWLNELKRGGTPRASFRRREPRTHPQSHAQSHRQPDPQESQGLKSLPPWSAWAPRTPEARKPTAKQDKGRQSGRAEKEDQAAWAWSEHLFFFNNQGVTVFKRRAANDMENIIQSLQKQRGCQSVQPHHLTATRAPRERALKSPEGRAGLLAAPAPPPSRQAGLSRRILDLTQELPSVLGGRKVPLF